jgi:hypothetical protein
MNLTQTTDVKKYEKNTSVAYSCTHVPTYKDIYNNIWFCVPRDGELPFCMPWETFFLGGDSKSVVHGPPVARGLNLRIREAIRIKNS